MLKPPNADTVERLVAAGSAHPVLVDYLRDARDAMLNNMPYVADDRTLRQMQGGTQALDDILKLLTRRA